MRGGYEPGTALRNAVYGKSNWLCALLQTSVVALRNAIGGRDVK